MPAYIFLGFLSQIAQAGGKREEECEWCGKTHDRFDKFCSKKCEADYKNYTYGDSVKTAEPEIHYEIKVIEVEKEVIKKEYIKLETFESWISLYLCLYAFGEDKNLDGVTYQAIKNNINRVFKVDVWNEQIQHFYQGVLEHWQGDFRIEDIEKIIQVVDSVQEMGTYFESQFKLKLMDVIVQTSIDLGLNCSDITQYNSINEVINLLGVTIETYNKLKSSLEDDCELNNEINIL